MKVTINLAEDLELRSEIRQMISAAIVSFAREEISVVIEKEISKKFDAFVSNKDFEMTTTIEKFVKAALSRQNITEQINTIVTKEVLKKLNSVK